jgi:hypothetical protein
MVWAARQLLNPLCYLRIRQGEGFWKSKATYDWTIPLILALFVEIIVFYCAPHLRVFTEKGIIGGFQKLMEILVPFYIAALAAVATFQRDGLDEEMKGQPAYFNIRSGKDEKKVNVLTRRQFICYLFGFLAFMSLSLFVIIIFCNLLADNLSAVAAHAFGNYILFAKIAVVFIFLFAIWQVVVTTLLGIYFLSERLQVMTSPNE